MRNARHIGRTAASSDKKLDFASPDARATARTAFHRYMPVESAEECTAQAASRVRGDDSFEEVDFRARWWRAPDLFE